jgi:RNA polymerase sigma factor (sigma-70 family)
LALALQGCEPKQQIDREVHLPYAIAATADSHRDEIEEIIQRYRKLVFTVAINVVRDSACAEEICQETFVKVWMALPSFQYRCPLSAWIYQIAKNISISHYRVKTKHRYLPLHELPDVASRSYPASQRLELRDMVRSLPERQRVAIELFYLQQWPIKDIALSLGIPEGTVRNRLHCARHALAAM